MERICINGVFFADFGENNYSYGMHLISTCATITTEQVLAGEFPGVYLNPSSPWNELEAFCVLGTPEQYAEFYERQRDAQISKRIIDGGYLNAPISEYRTARANIEKNYKDWWKA